jgi:hypothetical protein
MLTRTPAAVRLLHAGCHAHVIPRKHQDFRLLSHSRKALCQRDILQSETTPPGNCTITEKGGQMQKDDLPAKRCLS